MMEIQPKSPHNSKLITIIGAIGFLAVSIIVWHYGSFAMWDLERNSLRVDDVIENYQRYEGKQIFLRGSGNIVTSYTLILCEPDFCGCNSSLGEFYIGEILVEDFQCSGDQCSLSCYPLKPEDGIEYLLIGVLENRGDEYQGGQPRLSLTNVDFGRSRKLNFGRWVPIK